MKVSTSIAIAAVLVAVVAGLATNEAAPSSGRRYANMCMIMRADHYSVHVMPFIPLITLYLTSRHDILTIFPIAMSKRARRSWVDYYTNDIMCFCLANSMACLLASE
ncbi:hypothetical protein SYNPS1DRAFT_32051 [Syncephalis pseudoplumigaleata]|uniref:Uncharacterized protein n=1 Tax=Syncephalis pseudoplumigaleata TaxID=1712513 RepID=A0A4P9YRQ6_9FUNG|nr:hypothetical protein SYNPS1DRAFT_32051 [Syncephalis pseudoplumigaleata]|eukprot:RKP22365.1 hypothetical protein SYNPS1DRAFT_32051 [Syncephalis pseudoplumigaleata]